MKYLFLVQGEGRGHMTQAIALYSMLKEHGHEVVAVMIGKNPQRKIPTFVYEKLDCKVLEYESPNFIFNKQNKGVRIEKSLFYNLANSSKYFRSINLIRSIVKEKTPDVIVNFYDLMGGLYKSLHRDIKSVCIGHQFLLAHPKFPFPNGRNLEKRLLLMHNAIVSINASKCLALSFRPMDNIENTKSFVVPPLLRKEIVMTDPAKIQNKGFLHGYILNSGFATEIINWHKGKEELPIHFFWDKKDAPTPLNVHRNLFFHQINDHLFLEYLKNCDMFAGTAGFESLCEAMYLGKPFLCVPSVNHYEQSCNSYDATLEGAGVRDDQFNLDKLLSFRKNYSFDSLKFREWADSAPKTFLNHLTNL